MTYAFWDLIIGVDLGGVINGVQTFLPRRLSQGEPGHIVNTASAAGLAVTTGEQYIYHTAKYAVVGLSEALHQQLEPHQIGVTVPCPGLTATNALKNSRAHRPEQGVIVAPRRARAQWRIARLAPGIMLRVATEITRRERKRRTV